MAEIGALILPIGADSKNFEFTINDVKSAYRDLYNQIKNKPFNLVTQEEKKQLGELESTFKRLTNDVLEFGKAFQFPENSIEGINYKINQLTQKRIRLDFSEAAEEIANIQNEIDELIAKRDQIDILGRSVKYIAPSFNKVEDSSKRARTALTSLNLIVQDLPFGFIAIQNNIPGLIQQFGLLQTESKGIKGALSELGKSFKGPAGVFFAFTALTTIITFAIQKYGSLGNAIDALFGKIDPLKDRIDKLRTSFDEFNKELKTNEELTANAQAQESGRITTINALTRKATDLSLSEKERGKYLNQLKEIDKTYFGQLTTGADNIDKIKKATDGYIESIIRLSKIRAFENQLNAIDEQIAPLSLLRDELKLSSDSAQLLKKTSTKLFVDPTEKANNRLAENADQLEILYKRRSQVQAALESFVTNFTDVKDTVTNTTNEQKKYNEALNKFNQLKIEIPEVDDKKIIDKKISSLEKYGNILLDTTNYDFERADALKKVIAVDQEYFTNLDLNKTKLSEVKSVIEAYIQTLINLKKAQNNIVKVKSGGVFEELSNSLELFTKEKRIPTLFDKVFKKEDFENITKDVKNFSDRTGIEFDKLRQNIINSLILKQAQQKFVLSLTDIQNVAKEELAKIQEIASNLKLSDFLTIDAAKAEGDKIKELINTQQKAYESLKSSIENNLQKPLREFFDQLLDDGKLSFDSFVELAKDAFKRILAQAIASGIASLLANILSGGSATALTGAAKVAQQIGNAMKGGNIFKRGAVNFSGIEGGGLGLTGQVVFVQRGSDLVGVLNRTNSTIGRIG